MKTASTIKQPKLAPLPGKNLAVISIASMLLMLTVSMIIICSAAYDYADKTLTFEMVKKADSVANAVAATMNEAAALGIPLDKMPAVAADLERIRAKHVELQRISVVLDGVQLHSAKLRYERDERDERDKPLSSLTATAAINIVSEAEGLQRGTLEVIVDPRYIKRLFGELAIDLLVILVVSVFITLELIYFLAGPIVVSPLRSLTMSISNLTNGAIVGAIPGRFPGALRTLAMSLRIEQDSLVNEYRAAKSGLRKRLACYRACPTEAEKIALLNVIQQLRQLRNQFGLSTQTARSIVIDPSTALGRMRAPFFLMLLAEDLSRSFIPIYASTMAVGSLSISSTWVVGLPIFLFMFIVAVSQPVLGGWSERVGRRRAFLIGAICAITAHLLAAQSTTLAGLLVWRGLAGAAWAIAFVAAQGMVLDYTDSRTRAKGLAGFVSIIMVSLACGPSVGGLLADGLGYRATFVVAGVLAVLSLIVGWLSLPQDKPIPTRVVTQISTPSSHVKPHPLTNLKFLGLLLLAAVPAKLILVAYCYFLLPLYLTASGHSAATSGRIIMIYSVLMVLFVPIAADMLDRFNQARRVNSQVWFVSIGIALSGLAGLAMLIPNDIVAAAVLVSILGVAQALSITPQAAMVPQLARAEIAARGEATVYGYYRLVERIGSAVGPLVAAALLQWVTFRQSFIVLGAIVLACGIGFALLHISTSTSRESIVGEHD